MSEDTPRIIEPLALEARLQDQRLRIVDLSQADLYAGGHVPGAVHLDYGRIVTAAGPVMGLLPDVATLRAILAELGIGPDTHVVCYDEEGGGKAARFLWTLAVCGHEDLSLLSGGLAAWSAANLSTTTQPAPEAPPLNLEYPLAYGNVRVADRDWIMAHLRDEEVILMDARSSDEFTGRVAYAARGGHIPGAISFDWVRCLDLEHHRRLRPEETLRQALLEQGITPEKEIVVYCHTHHRSALNWLVLEHLGYERVRGYPGSWSDWGNRDDTPIET
ncbi:sulfurtransferase [Ectothiorhodospira lacustris]|uniref:sulfurtransferase n=1 Tax=Ectothiorhodospira lacustris TaxID=2899127 RepID=UPI001EE93CE6|nr:sulfurtransferase [Ectothiorhodospira lacustris]MCG5500540.1 sulfurtransferase [Ectothiorhodospira lacustris]MCG5509387.1 sulfurtransferase [Ectothiorhodospira lacustris]MCG5521441.1 sulfurtransferase [Ectothiorhodospira lacustris]